MKTLPEALLEGRVKIRLGEAPVCVVEHHLYAMGMGYFSGVVYYEREPYDVEVMGICVTQLGAMSLFYKDRDEDLFEASDAVEIDASLVLAEKPEAYFQKMLKIKSESEQNRSRRELVYRVGQLDPKTLSEEQVSLLKQVFKEGRRVD